MAYQNQRRVPFTVPYDATTAMNAMMSDDMMATATNLAVGLIGLEHDHVVLQVKFERPGGNKPGQPKGLRWWLLGRHDSQELVRTGTGIHTIQIPLPDLGAAHIKGWWNRVILLTTNDLTHFEELTWASADTLKLNVARKHRSAAEDLVHELQMRLSDLGMARLDERIVQLEQGDGEPLSIPKQASDGS